MTRVHSWTPLVAVTPEIQSDNHIFAKLVLVDVNDLTRRRMHHSDILVGLDIDELSVIHAAYLDEVWLERQNVWLVNGERLRRSFPLDFPVIECSPSVPVDKKCKIGIAEEEGLVEALDVNRLQVFLEGDEVKRGVSLIQQRLSDQRVQCDDFKTSSASNTERGAQKVH